MHVARGAAGVVSVEQGHDQRLARQPFVDCRSFDAEKHAGCNAARIFEAHQTAIAKVRLAQQFYLVLVPVLCDAPHIAELL